MFLSEQSVTSCIYLQFGSTLHVNIRGITFNTIILRSCLSEMVNRSIQSQSPCYVQPNDRSTSILTTCTIHHFSKHFYQELRCKRHKTLITFCGMTFQSPFRHRIFPCFKQCQCTQLLMQSLLCKLKVDFPEAGRYTSSSSLSGVLP